MKKIIFVAVALLFSTILFSSCKKAYRCVCNDGLIVNPYLNKLSKSQADDEKAKCEATAGCVFERDK